jgi:hypothetical protein
MLQRQFHQCCCPFCDRADDEHTDRISLAPFCVILAVSILRLEKSRRAAALGRGLSVRIQIIQSLSRTVRSTKCSGGDRFIMVISQALVNLAATVGIVGSIVGLFLSAPLIAIFGTLVWSTSCAGKTLARQNRSNS